MTHDGKTYIVTMGDSAVTVEARSQTEARSAVIREYGSRCRITQVRLATVEDIVWFTPA